jgi:hypothetical protein
MRGTVILWRVLRQVLGALLLALAAEINRRRPPGR